MNSNLNLPTRAASLRFLFAWRVTAGLFALFAAALAQAQDDLPFSSGSTGADGPLDVPEHPTYRQGAEMGYDRVNEQLVLFGGNWGGTYYPETYVTSDPAQGWTRLETDTFLSARSHTAMAWDGNNETLVLFGGYRADGTIMGDFWSWDGSDWTQIEVDTPPARQHPLMATDPNTGNVYLTGGRSASNSELSDLWVWDGTEWTELTEIGTPPRTRHAYDELAWDPSDDSLLFYSEVHRETTKFKNGTWSVITTATTPNVGYGSILVTDESRNSCILFGGAHHRGETWEFKNGEWILLSTDRTPNRRYYHAAAYDVANQQVVVSNGWMDNVWSSTSNVPNYDSWAFKDGDWSFQSGRLYYFDMTERETGIWNFTSIHVPSSAEVRFVKNASNTPVVWLATESVLIDGYLRLDGQDALSNDGADNYAVGGPGGAAGGLGAIRFDVSGNYAGTPGQGAGGGAPGVTSGEYGSPANFRNVYGNTLLLPLVGGSGGGGGASNASANGGHGAGGGGAILIASDGDITVNGLINADGGWYTWGGASYGGYGSGGAIKLMADRVNGSGNLWARGGRRYTDDTSGRIRIEAFFRPLAANTAPAATATAPIAAPDFGDQPTLTIVSVDGAAVTSPPTGNLQTPDVVFTADGTVNVVVGSTNIPQGTPVTLRITSSGEIISLPGPEDPEVTVNAEGNATFSAEVPAGLGTIQAFSEFTP